MGMKICSNCGYQCNDDVRFCIRCAYSFSDELMQESPVQQSSEAQASVTLQHDSESTKNPEEDYKSQYADEMKKARDKELQEAEEAEKRRSEEARRQELERINKNSQSDKAPTDRAEQSPVKTAIPPKARKKEADRIYAM